MKNYKFFYDNGHIQHYKAGDEREYEFACVFSSKEEATQVSTKAEFSISTCTSEDEEKLIYGQPKESYDKEFYEDGEEEITSWDYDPEDIHSGSEKSPNMQRIVSEHSFVDEFEIRLPHFRKKLQVQT